MFYFKTFVFLFGDRHRFSVCGYSLCTKNPSAMMTYQQVQACVYLLGICKKANVFKVVINIMIYAAPGVRVNFLLVNGPQQ